MRRTRISSQGNSYRRAPARHTHPQWHARFLSVGRWCHQELVVERPCPAARRDCASENSIPGISSAEFLLRPADTPRTPMTPSA